MVMGVSAKIRNGFECFCKCNIFVFQIWVKKNSVRRSVLVFGNVSFNIVVRINHDNVASRGAVGRTHTIVRLQARIRRKDGTENFGGFVYVVWRGVWKGTQGSLLAWRAASLLLGRLLLLY